MHMGQANTYCASDPESLHIGIHRNKSILIMTHTERGFEKRVRYLQKDVPQVMRSGQIRVGNRLTLAVQDGEIM